MKMRGIQKVYETTLMREGAGVLLERGISQAEAEAFDPFLLFDDFSNTDPAAYAAGFPWHPHRGMETVTYILKGEAAHEDSLGNTGVLGAGDVQWMTAGSGIIHQEMPRVTEEGIQGFQLWVNLPKKDKMMAPRYQNVVSEDIPIVEKGGACIAVIAGEYEGVCGPVKDLVVEPTYLDVSLKRGGEFSYRLPESHTAFLYIISGSVSVRDGSEFVTAGHVVLTSKGEQCVCVAHTPDTRFLFIAGKPLKEPIAWHGPIVMNTGEEITQALDDYHKGTFTK